MVKQCDWRGKDMIYTKSPKAYFQVCEDDDKKEYVQMDQIMKRLFTLKNKKPIIDFLNAAYKDDLSYDAKISYSNTEIINTKNLSAQYVAFHADIFITAEEGNNIFEYAIEFQTAFDKDIAIRMFRYSFERAVRLDYYREKNRKGNKYLLYPIQVFNLRKAMEIAKSEEERRELYDQMKATIVNTLNAIDKDKHYVN